MILCLSRALSFHQPLGKMVTMYRGVPENCAQGEIIHDVAFNSVTPDPKVAEFFGNVILKITFAPSDKLLYFSGRKFYASTLEFITPPGISYQVIKREQKGNKLYVEAFSLGCTNNLNLSISNIGNESYRRKLVLGSLL